MLIIENSHNILNMFKLNLLTTFSQLFTSVFPVISTDSTKMHPKGGRSIQKCMQFRKNTVINFKICA